MVPLLGVVTAAFLTLGAKLGATETELRSGEEEGPPTNLARGYVRRWQAQEKRGRVGEGLELDIVCT